MEIKQEPVDCSSFENTKIIKETVFLPIDIEIKVEQSDFHSQNLRGVKQEVRNSSNCAATHVGINFSELNKIKQEIDYVVTKNELLGKKYDSPLIERQLCPANNAPSSSKQNSLLGKHVAKKKSKIKNYCPVCMKRFTSSLKRKNHVALHFKTSQAICIYCGKFFTRKSDFSYHYHEHFIKSKSKQKLTSLCANPQSIIRKTNLFKCDICPSTFKLKYSLKYHILFKHLERKPYKCEFCQKKFGHKSYLKGHVRTHTGEKPFVCNLCSKPFAKRQYLKYHLKTHTQERRFQCEFCLKRFSQKVSLLDHRRIHTGEKPYACDVCLKPFSRKHELKRHNLVHSGLQPYKCDVCSKAFKKRDNLKLHALNHTGEKPFKCEICLKAFKGRHNLKIHTRVHTGERPFKCDICSKAFKVKPTLNQHLKSHNKDFRPFTCEMCAKGFTRRSGLTSHYRTHAAEKRYKCDICGVAYAAKISLKKHNASVHPEPVNYGG